jgi:hypothetical protein
MKASDLPTRFPVPFAGAATSDFIRSIPKTSTDPAAASLDLGFPPVTFTPVGSGGIPPNGRDFNGILNQATAWSRWQGAGGPIPYDATFATAIGGYPAGSILASTTVGLYWISTADDNTTNPDAGGAGWRLLNRIRLNAALSLYVATTGNDSNDGLSLSTPFATLQKAWDVAQQKYDLNGFPITCNVADGTYAAGIAASGPLVGATSSSSFSIVGNIATPGNVIIHAGAANCFLAQNVAMMNVRGMRLLSDGQYCLNSQQNSRISFDTIEFGASPVGGHMNQSLGGLIVVGGNYSIVGGGGTHVNLSGNSQGSITAVVINLTGTPNFTVAFAQISLGSALDINGNTFNGSATGKRYSAQANGVIYTNGAGPNYLPGDVAGATATGGQYV